MGGEEPEYPPLTLAGYLVDWFLDVGPDWSAGMERSALPNTEVQAWAQNTSLDIYKTEADWLIHMSRAYVAEIARSHDKETRAPYVSANEIEGGDRN